MLAEIGDLHVNEQGIELGVIKREDLFITTKLWNDDHHRVEDAMDDSLKNFGIDWVDLWLMHWPVAGNDGDTVNPPIKACPLPAT